MQYVWLAATSSRSQNAASKRKGHRIVRLHTKREWSYILERLRRADMSIYTSFIKKHMEENEAIQLLLYAAASIHLRSEFNVAATVANLT